ncbi:beta-propeller domain-containing protein [Actinoplanes sp. NPDC051633]|uniref:beta-propeller domain-containing protein n=1 Tax=Actinoplanes sp. NPDC051633 TaxID=3155670 RepID=UPI0034333819
MQSSAPPPPLTGPKAVTKFLGLALVATLPLVGCTSSGKDPDPVPTTPRVTTALRLVAFDSCAQLRDDLRAAAKKSVGPYGLGGDVVAFAADGAMPEGARAAAPANAAADKAATPEFSGTNTHEAGVDEPDIVKTDGRRIVTISQNKLLVVDAASKKVTGTLPLGQDVYGGNLLLSGDRALVLVEAAQGFYDGPSSPKRPYAYGVGGTKVILVDLAGSPRIVSEFESNARLIDARQTGGAARVVLSSTPRITFPDLPNTRDDRDRINANRKAIDRAGVDAWLPEWSVTTGGTVEKGQVGCGDVRRPPVYSGKSVLSVLTFDIAAPKLDNGRPVAIVADGDTVYGTPTSLYIANDQRWRFDIWRGGRGDKPPAIETEIFRFAVTGTEPPTYEAAGQVKGWLVNQYAMSEWDGHLRVATTDDNAASSAVRVLRPDGDTLKEVGSVGGLGKNEKIYSVRFIGDRGYVVTFRQTDPLYSLDLSDPAKPRVTGELKINGYSAHLQPVGEDRLIGVGQEADDQGRRQGTQVSLFDVSDPAAPRRLAQQVVSSGSSEAEYDPHAILWWPATKLFVVPISTYTTVASAGALALTVTDSGLTQAGKLTAPLEAEGYSPQIRRTLVIGNELWALTETGLQASALSNLEPVATLKF